MPRACVFINIVEPISSTAAVAARRMAVIRMMLHNMLDSRFKIEVAGNFSWLVKLVQWLSKQAKRLCTDADEGKKEALVFDGFSVIQWCIFN